MNNTIIWGHPGLFMYIDGGYYGYFHDMNILWHFLIYYHFIHINDYFEYLLGDPRYMGEKMFIMHEIGQHKLTPNVDHDANIQQNA